MTPAGRSLVRIAVVLAVLLGLAAAWTWTPLSDWADPQRLSAWIEPYRTSWFALPLVLVAFIVLELVLFPVLVLVFVCGLAFGPWLGMTYAVAGAVASAIPPFLLGRRLGRARLERWFGAPMRKIDKLLERRSVIAVFLVRKIPAPYSLVNLACGACGLKLLDFAVGTFLGMVTGIVLLTFAGGQIGRLLSDPDPGRLAFTAGVLASAVVLVLLAQRLINRRLGDRRVADESP